MNIRVKVDNLSDYLESRLIEEISLDLELLGIEGGTIVVEDDPDENQITFDAADPSDVIATVWLNDNCDWEEWHGKIDTAGVVQSLTDTNGKQYHTRAELKAAGVKRITLEPQHIIWIAD